MSTGPGGPPPGEDDEATFADVFNAFTLDSRRRKKRKKSAGEDPELETDAGPSTYGGEPVYPGEQAYPGEPTYPGEQAYPGEPEYYPGEPGYGQYAAEAYSPPPEPGPAAQPPGPPGFFEPAQGTGLFEPAVSNTGPAEYYYDGYEQPAEEAAVVRPYALTGGRTKANLELELETLLSTSEAAVAQGDQVAVQFEHRAIMEECRTPRSVAEIAALLRVPLGVARVLISDAAGAGLITVHETVSGNDDAEARLMLMERVLSGLRRL
ncbi:DUF742 domain-containing protein [Amycolatopsis taiwanensis]|uniref:DUF742 domain-containing protein n=1 Tax=Amycolatopsis taiwanensis TaxID=342230 RepID=UPI00047FE401|nr:DUF742 domain-containing protein [Amycolatopsis taiwanensis]